MFLLSIKRNKEETRYALSSSGQTTKLIVFREGLLHILSPKYYTELYYLIYFFLNIVYCYVM